MWIEKNILASAGFMGRISLRMNLKELPLKASSKLVGLDRLSKFDKLKILSITGGVPRYLEEIKASKDAENNIKELCFVPEGVLLHEFDDIFSDLFSRRNNTYKKIVSLLVSGPKSIKALCEKLGFGQTGMMTEYLEDLVKAGFISRDYTWNLKDANLAGLSRFRLSDNYLRFYLKYIDKNKEKIIQNHYQYKSMASLPGWQAVLGLQFENLVLNNRDLIRCALGVMQDDLELDGPFFQRSTVKQAGCQIDYLIQAKHGALYVCEIKFSRDPIKKSIIKEMKSKIERLKRPKGFSCFPVLICVSGVEDEVLESRYFSSIIDFSEFC